MSHFSGFCSLLVQQCDRVSYNEKKKKKSISETLRLAWEECLGCYKLDFSFILIKVLS